MKLVTGPILALATAQSSAVDLNDPRGKRALFKYLVSQTNGIHDMAVGLGWRQPDLAEESAYALRVKNAALLRHGGRAE